MKTYVIAATVLALVGLLFGAYRAGYSQGQTRAKFSYQQEALALRDRENKLLLQLEEARKERKIVYRERIKLVRETKDVCLDRPVPESITRLLHDDRHSGAEPASDTGL
jgi:hypothetical protein